MLDVLKRMNKAWDYKYKELWQDEPWEKLKSPIAPLAHWIEGNAVPLPSGNRMSLEEARAKYPDASYNPKTVALTLADKVKILEDMGLSYNCFEMSNISWLLMSPKNITVEQRCDMKTLLVLYQINYEDPMWAMNAIDFYMPYIERAAKDGMTLIFIAPRGVDLRDEYINIIQEASAVCHIGLKNFFLDLTAVYDAGLTLSQIPKLGMPDHLVEEMWDLKIPVLEISDIWASVQSTIRSCVNGSFTSNKTFERERFYNSIAGQKMAEAMGFEYEFSGPGKEVEIYFKNRGILFETHTYQGEQWTTLSPLSIKEDEETKLPVLAIFQESRNVNRHQVISAIAYFWEFCNLAAQGDCILLFFVLETSDDNDMLHDILADAEKLYPIDRSRVYLTGHSHNGHFVMEYMRRHHEDLAAVATLGNMPGQPAPEYSREHVMVTDEKLEQMKRFDMPIINITGYNEGGCMFPLNQDAFDYREEDKAAIRPGTFEERAKSWQRRLEACNCPMKSLDEIAATQNSDDYVTRKLGIPNDKTECSYLYGNECYIADIKNNEGKYHLRMAAVENMPHFVAPANYPLVWSFVRRFARDQETDEIVELY